MSDTKPAKSRKKAESAEAGSPPPPAPPLRVTTFTQEVADLICEALAEGHSLRSICAADNMPSKSTVFKWLSEQKAFSDQYARAREAQADCLFDDILEIADDGRNDSYLDDEGNRRTDTDVIQRSKLRVEARKWMASKLAPKRYGEKLQHTGDGGGPIPTEVTFKIIRPNGN
jgi:hypothetical protein